MLRQEGGKLVGNMFGMRFAVEPWGRDAIRVRATRNAEFPPETGTLLELPTPAGVEILITGEGPEAVALTTGVSDLAGMERKIDAKVVNGNLSALVSAQDAVRLNFVRNSDGKTLLESESLVECYCGGEEMVTGALTSHGDGTYKVEARFKAYPDEKFFGLGQHPHGLLDQKGCVLDLLHRNTEVNIPFALSNRGHGFIWNNPAVGRVELGATRTLWAAERTRALDFVVIAGDRPAEILERYADITGHAPVLPEWASGFWQSKLRYVNQEELLEVARAHRRRGLPLSAIVVDFFNWSHSGDFKFKPEYWPDPAAMAAELKGMGVELVVSNWPTVSRHSENFAAMRRDGMLVAAESGLPFMLSFRDHCDAPGREPLALVDPTNPETREFVWKRVREGYFQSGIKTFWLDAIEPELIGVPDFTNLHYHIGNARETCGLYPWHMQQLYFEGLKAEGVEAPLTLGRSAFLGSQRFGAAVWNGDIVSSFEMLGVSIRAGLNIAVSGIPWWTTDIGGFMCGDTTTDEFRELIVRWFEYGVFCPLFRLHGARRHPDFKPGRGENDPTPPNEVWSFGDQAYRIISRCLRLRESLRPYIMRQMRAASETGLPPMRPLFVDFPDDPKAWEVDDQYLFGPDLLVAPVYRRGATSREVYLAAGESWRDAFTGETFPGGATVQAAAPLDKIPVYARMSSTLKLNL